MRAIRARQSEEENEAILAARRNLTEMLRGNENDGQHEARLAAERHRLRVLRERESVT